MTASSHERFEHSAGAYLLGSLPELEARAFEQHVMACPRCHEELERLRVAVEALPRAVAPVSPPAGLRASLLETARGEAPGRAKRSTVASAHRLRAASRRMRAAVALISAALLLVVCLAAGWALAELAEREGEQTIAARVDHRRTPNASGSLLVPDGGRQGGILRVQGLARPRDGQVYQVWLRRGGEIAPGSLFTVRYDGSGTAGIDRLDDVDAVMVTRERTGGAPAPTEPPVMLAPVEK